MRGYMYIFAFLIASSSFLQGLQSETPKKVGLTPNWKVGDIVHFSVRKERNKKNGFGLWGTKSDLEIRVLEKLDDGYILQWSFSHLVSDDSLKSDTLAEGMLNLDLQLKVKYLVDSFGMYQKLLEIEDIRRQLEKEKKEIQSHLPKDKAEKLDEGFRVSLGTDSQIQNLVSKKIELFHNVFGSKYEINKDYSIQVAMTNPWGGEPFIGDLTLNAEPLGSGGLFKTNVRVKLNKHESKQTLTRFLEKIVQDLSEKNNVKQAEFNRIMESVDVTENSIYQLRDERNWPELVFYERNVELRKNVRLERWEFRREDK